MAARVAKDLQVPLDVVVARKLGVPFHEEYAFGALAAPDCVVMNEGVARMLGLSHEDIQKVIQKEASIWSR